MSKDDSKPTEHEEVVKKHELTEQEKQQIEQQQLKQKAIAEKDLVNRETFTYRRKITWTYLIYRMTYYSNMEKCEVHIVSYLTL